jgi:cholesterol oxidase
VVSAEEHADVVIVGSGFGGAVAACRLASSDRTVVVLERGRDWSNTKTPQRFRDYLYSSRMPQLLNGWLDIRWLDQMVVATGAGVGGGSLIYANVCVDAPDLVFRSGWPSEITADEMKRYYDKVTKVLQPQTIPVTQFNPRMEMLNRAAAAIGAGARYRPLPLAVTFDDTVCDTGGEPWRDPDMYKPETCVHCGNCVVGCETGAKHTLDRNYLAEAREQGAEIRPLSMVTHIEQGPAGAWRVHYLDVDAGLGRRKRQIVGKIVILAAGSLGSTEILLRSRDGFRTLKNLPRALGKGWSPNGDFLTLARYRNGRPLQPTKGPTIGGVIDFLDGVDLPDDNTMGVDGRLYIEDGGLPNLGAHVLHSWKDVGGLRARLYRKASSLTDFSDMIPWFGQSIDAADGEFSLQSPFKFWRARTRLNWNPQRSVNGLDTFSAMHVAITRATGGEPLPLFTWKRLRTLITPHPLGGCNMAAAPGAGVTNHMGEVFGYGNLFVMDGSVIPRAIGRNPSKTIAAIAERNCEKLLDELPARLDYRGAMPTARYAAST